MKRKNPFNTWDIEIGKVAVGVHIFSLWELIYIMIYISILTWKNLKRYKVKKTNWL